MSGETFEGEDGGGEGCQMLRGKWKHGVYTVSRVQESIGIVIRVLLSDCLKCCYTEKEEKERTAVYSLPSTTSFLFFFFLEGYFSIFPFNFHSHSVFCLPFRQRDV